MRHRGEELRLTIGEVAAAIGVSRQTLRVWEAKGLLIPGRTPGGHRLYSEQHLERAHHIVELRRRFGWNPAAILDALPPEEGSTDGGARWTGNRLRAARRERGLSLKEAARRIGISPSLLSSWERGEASISSAMVARLADAYLMPMSGFASFRARDSTVVGPEKRARSVLVGGVTWEELALPGHEIEPALLSVPPRQGSGGPYSRPGETFAFVLAGKLRFRLPETAEEVLVKKDDAIILAPRTPFSWENPGTRRARALWVEHLRSEPRSPR